MKILPALGKPFQSTIRAVRTRPFLLVLALLVVLAMIGIFTPGSAFAKDDGPVPQGFGDLLGGPDLTDGGAYSPTLYEAYPSNAYFFDTNRLNMTTDLIHQTLNGLATLFMFMTIAVVRGAIVLVWTMFEFSGGDDLADTVSGNIGVTATALLGWLLPIALVIGALVAYSQSRGTQGGGFGQLLWVFAGGLLAVSFATSPSLWVDTLTDARNVTAQAVMSATAESVETSNQPFKYPDATFDESEPTDKMLRLSADAIWRAYVVTPWCLANFGSQEACTAYGKSILDVGTNADERSKWIQKSDDGHPGEYDSDGASYRWIAGKNSAERLGMAIIAFLVAAVFGILVIIIAFMSLLAFISAIMLLFVGVFFVMMWCIPGKPRAWGNSWFETVFGLMIQSVIGVLVLSATLVMTAGAFGLAGTNGWGVAAGLSIMICIAAFSMRRTVAGIMGALSPGMGMTTLIGASVMRGGARMLGKAGKAVVKRGTSAVKSAGKGIADTLTGANRGGRSGQNVVGKHRNPYRETRPSKPRNTKDYNSKSFTKKNVKPEQGKNGGPADKTQPTAPKSNRKPPTATEAPGAKASTYEPNPGTQAAIKSAPRMDGTPTFSRRPSRSAASRESGTSEARPRLRNNPPAKPRPKSGRTPAEDAAKKEARTASKKFTITSRSGAITPRREYRPRAPQKAESGKR